MNICILLTKTYRKSDLSYWLSYHLKIFDKIIVFDNESTVNIDSLLNDERIIKLDIKGFPDQYKLYSKTMNNLLFEENDLITFLDDDEYLFVDKSTSFEISINKLLTEYKMNIVHLPEILMGSNTILSSRQYQLPIEYKYRRNDVGNICKSIIKYESNSRGKYSFLQNKDNDTIGHIPTIDDHKVSCGFGENDISYTNYAKVIYDAPIRLYHYHLKSLNDWKIKIERGSAATDIPWYDDKIESNYAFGGYDTLDTSIIDNV